MIELEEQNNIKFSDSYDDLEMQDNQKIQFRLLASADLSEGLFNFTVLQPMPFSPDVSQPQHYNITQVQLNVEELPIVDKINLSE